MLYDYRCHICSHEFELDFKIGEAKKSVPCPLCHSDSKRLISHCNFILKGGGWPSKKERFNKEMTKKNELAGSRMLREHGEPPMKLVAHDYGNGDIREV